jgi:hypothetical protein
MEQEIEGKILHDLAMDLLIVGKFTKKNCSEALEEAVEKLSIREIIKRD